MESNTTTSLRATLPRDTMLRPGAPSCIPLLFQATSQIEGLCNALQRLIVELDTDTDTIQPCAVMLGLTARIKAMNSVLMSYTDGDDITMAEAYRAIYGLEVGKSQWEAISASESEPSTESDYMEGVELAVDIFKMGKALPGPEQDACELSAKIHFVFLKDPTDHPQVQKRMDITAKLYQDRGLPVEILELKGENETHKIFSSLVLADWAAYYTGEGYGLETEQVPMVEEFKGLIK